MNNLLKDLSKLINTAGGMATVAVMGACFIIASTSFFGRVASPSTAYHFKATLQFEGTNFAREQTPLPIVGDATVQCTSSDEWALDANVTCQWLDDLNEVSVTALISDTSTLPLEVNVSVFPVNYTPLASEGK
jgi:hypothetical protein